MSVRDRSRAVDRRSIDQSAAVRPLASASAGSAPVARRRRLISWYPRCAATLQRRRARERVRVGIGARNEQRVDDARVAVERGGPQRALAARAPAHLVDVRARVEDQSHEVRVAGLHRAYQRRRPLRILQAELHRLGLRPRFDDVHQGRVACEELLHEPVISLPDRDEDGNRILGVRRGAVNAATRASGRRREATPRSRARAENARFLAAETVMPSSSATCG